MDQQLNLQKYKVNLYLNMDGTCPTGYCDHCGNASLPDTVTEATISHEHPVEDEFSLPELTIIGALAFLFVVIVILFVIIICCLRKRLIGRSREILSSQLCSIRTPVYSLLKIIFRDLKAVYCFIKF